MGAFPAIRALCGAPYDVDALAWRRAVLAQGGTVGAAELQRVARLVRALDESGAGSCGGRELIRARSGVDATRQLARHGPAAGGRTAATAAACHGPYAPPPAPIGSTSICGSVTGIPATSPR